MTATPRPPQLLHCTSEPFRFFGREAELALLRQAATEGGPSLVALLGPGGQGKTAIVQHWLEPFLDGRERADGVFLWSFYRGKDADRCIRELYAYVSDLPRPPDVSASYCVDHLLPELRRGRWLVVLDGSEVVQHEAGEWYGRFLHPELGRLLEEAASVPLPGVILLTSRFPPPELERRPFARLVTLGGLDPASARELLRSLGVQGQDAELDRAAGRCGLHPKAVELLGTYLARFHGGDVSREESLPEAAAEPGMSPEEQSVSRVLAAFRQTLAAETQDVLALATAFREPPPEPRLLDYLASPPVRELLHTAWARTYVPFPERGNAWLAAEVEELVRLRLLERVAGPGGPVIDAHPLVRRSFELVLGGRGRRDSARARAGFLRGRPDRRKAATLAEAAEDMELFHAYCDAGLWAEADAALADLDKPRYRFLAPALERDLLLRFYPERDFSRPPLWPGFYRRRELAICLELLGDFEQAVEVYPEADAALRGDALLALGRLGPLLDGRRAAHPWQTLWDAYRCHALCLAGRVGEAVDLAASLVPVDVYEWVHLFECLLRAGRLDAIDLRSFLYRPPRAAESRWSELARARMRADYLRVTAPGEDLAGAYRELLDAYDRAGLPFERALTRLGYSCWLLAARDPAGAGPVVEGALQLARRHGMRVLGADALETAAAVARAGGDVALAEELGRQARAVREAAGFRGPSRP